jgi:hypothetical protein
MTYAAKIIKVHSLIPHPNADRLQLLRYNGMQFVVGLDVTVGQLVALLPVDGQLSQAMCHANNLYRDAAQNVDPLHTGFFEDNRKVRAQKFRKENSDGFVIGIDALLWTGIKPEQLTEGLEFTSLNGQLVCEKYITPATRQRGGQPQSRSSKGVEYNLPKHFDTEQLAYNLDKLPNAGLVIITCKVHGTSARTGYVKVERGKYPWYAKYVNDLFRRQVIKSTVTSKYEYVSGTRNTICNDREDCTTPTGQEYYRWQWHEKIAPMLRVGETVYYEIVGFTHTGAPIMSPQDTTSLKDKRLEVRFGKQMVYRYGCEDGQNTVFVYRITVQNDAGDVVELPWYRVVRRCEEMGLKPVPALSTFYTDKALASTVMQEVAELLTDGPSSIDGRHMREGVVVRIESENGMQVYKQKNHLFLVLEGVAKEKDFYIDTEEVN